MTTEVDIEDLEFRARAADGDSRANAQFVEAASPRVVLALTAALRSRGLLLSELLVCEALGEETRERIAAMLEEGVRL